MSYENVSASNSVILICVKNPFYIKTTFILQLPSNIRDILQFDRYPEVRT